MTSNTERDYLVRRLRDLNSTKRETFAVTYNIYGDNSPKSYKELIDAIKNDKFTLDTKRTGKIDAAVAAGESVQYVSRGAFDGIKWTLPDAPDLDGYNIAIIAMQETYQSAMDIVQTSDAATGLKAMQDFDAWTYTAPVTPAA